MRQVIALALIPIIVTSPAWTCFGLDTAGEFIMLGREPS